MAVTFVRAAVVIMIMTLLSRIIGFVREVLLAHQFGLLLHADAFRIAFMVPNTLFLFIPGALNAVFLPILKGLLENEDQHNAQGLYHKMFTVLVFGYILLAAVGYFLSPQIVQLIAPTYDGEQFKLTVELMQIMWPSAIFIALIGLFQATLNAHKQFFVPMLGTIVNSLVIIAAYPLIVPHYGIYGVAMGTTIGFLAAVLTMLPALRRSEYSIKLDIQWKTVEMKKIGERFVPIMIGSLATQMTVFIEGYLATGIGDGPISALRMAFSVYQLPMAIFVGAFTLPILPYLVEFFNQGQFDKMKASLTEAFQYLFILMIPTIAAFVIIPNHLISLLFYWGAGSQMNVEDVEMVALALMLYSVGLFFLAGRDLLTRAFYAMGNTMFPVIAAVAGIVCFVGASYVFIPYLGHGGIALGTSIGSLLNMLLLSFALRYKIRAFIQLDFWQTALKTLIASGLMGILLYYVTLGWNDFSLWVHKLSVSGMIVVAAGLYLVLMLLMKDTKTVALKNSITNKLVRLKRGK